MKLVLFYSLPKNSLEKLLSGIQRQSLNEIFEYNTATWEETNAYKVE